MSFLDNPRNAGTAIFLVGIITMILGVVMIVLAVTSDEYDTVFGALSGVGALISGFIYFGLGKDVRNGTISDKWDILTRFVLCVAMVTIIQSILGIGGTSGEQIGSTIIGVIIGLIIFFVYKKMTDGKATTVDKIIWILLVIIFIIEIILNIIALLAFPIGTLMGICGIIIYCFMLITVLDNDVKAKMGM